VEYKYFTLIEVNNVKINTESTSTHGAQAWPRNRKNRRKLLATEMDYLRLSSRMSLKNESIEQNGNERGRHYYRKQKKND
jgi:hypothetical protein